MSRIILFTLAFSMLSFTPLQGADIPQNSEKREICPFSGAPIVVEQSQSVGLRGISLNGMTFAGSPSPVGRGDLKGGSRGITQWIDLNGPYSAYVMSLAVDEQNRDKIFCTTSAGGVFRSLDGAASWEAVHDGMYYDYPKQISIDPNDSNIVFCASNSYWRPDGMSDIYKSVDGGTSWTSCGMISSYWGGMFVCRNDSSVILAGSDNGIWRSIDGGNTWGWIYGSSTVLSFCEDPSAPDTIYAGTYGGGIYRSTDRGATWTTLSIPACGNIRIVAVHGQNSNIIYAAGNPAGIFRSTDYGATWSNVKAFVAWGVACAPTNGDVVYAVGEGPAFTGTPGVFVSSDAGATWTTCTLNTEHFYAPFAMRVAVDPVDPGIAYVGLYRAGVFKTTDGGATWSDANFGLKNCFVTEVLSHPSDPATIWAGTWQAGIYKTSDAGKTWYHADAGWMGAEINRGVEVIVMDPGDPDHLLLGGFNSGVWQSFDGGESWSATSLQNYGEIQAITFSPSDPSQVWAGSTNSSSTLGIWKSTDGGTSWLKKKSGVACYSISVHPTNPDMVIATTGTWMMDDATIQRTVDGGSSWTTVYQEGYGTVADSSISPVKPNLVWATSFNNNVLGSINGGITWYKNVGGFDPPGRPFTIEADPYNAQIAYLPLDDDGGMYFTLDYGMNWYSYNPGLWSRALVPLHIGLYPLFPMIYYTGTMGNGVFAAIIYK